MAEITPIIPSPTVIGPRKIERDEARKNKPQQMPRPKEGEASQARSDETQADGHPSQHIDERV